MDAERRQTHKKQCTLIKSTPDDPSRDPRSRAQGSRTCGECPTGYAGDGTSCTFLGPCHVNNGGCSPTAVCAQVSSTVQCFCTQVIRGLSIHSSLYVLVPTFVLFLLIYNYT